MSYRPTDEQQQVIDAFGAGLATLVVEAGAGCGKSSTLRMTAASAPTRKGVYVAYNKALADEAKGSMPASVMSRTAHSLAYGPVGSRFRHRLNGSRLPAREVARVLGIREPIRIGSDRVPLAPQQLARIVMDAVGRFCNTADSVPSRWHVRRVNGYTDAEHRQLAQAVEPWVVAAWDDLCAETGSLKYTHDCYLKQWQLSKPIIPADFILLDEAQDISPVMADIFGRQEHAQRIMVGDSAQAIYGWRGAVDALSRFQADQRLTLSQSFRFGTAIADEANKWLELLDAKLRLRGFDQVDSRLARLDTPDVILCRSNGEAVSQLMSALDDGRRACLVGGGTEIRRLAEAARDLQSGRGTAHPELFAFTSWAEVKEYAEQDAGGSDLRVIVRLVETWGPAAIISAVDRMSHEDRADLVISTAHKAKGREWDRVRIAEDFRSPAAGEDGDEPDLPGDDELMLAYVSVTRARRVLDRGSLAWVDDVTASTAAPGIGDLIEASSLGTPEAQALREQARADVAGVLTGMPAEQADWDGDELSAKCLRCGEHHAACACRLMPDRRTRSALEREAAARRMRADGADSSAILLAVHGVG